MDTIKCTVAVVAPRPGNDEIRVTFAVKKTFVKPTLWNHDEWNALFADESRGINCSLEEGISKIQRLGPLRSVTRGGITHLIFDHVALEINFKNKQKCIGLSWTLDNEQQIWNMFVTFPKELVKVSFYNDEGYTRQGRPCIILRCSLIDSSKVPTLPDDSSDEEYAPASKRWKLFFKELNDSTTPELLLSIPVGNDDA